MIEMIHAPKNKLLIKTDIENDDDENECSFCNDIIPENTPYYDFSISKDQYNDNYNMIDTLASYVFLVSCNKKSCKYQYCAYLWGFGYKFDPSQNNLLNTNIVRQILDGVRWYPSLAFTSSAGQEGNDHPDLDLNENLPLNVECDTCEKSTKILIQVAANYVIFEDGKITTFDSTIILSLCENKKYRIIGPSCYERGIKQLIIDEELKNWLLQIDW